MRKARDAINEFGGLVGSVKFPFLLQEQRPDAPGQKQGTIDRLGWLTSELDRCCPTTLAGAEFPLAGKPHAAAHNILSICENPRLNHLYLHGHFIEDEIRALVAELRSQQKRRNISGGLGNLVLVAATSELSEDGCAEKYGKSFEDRIAEVAEWAVRYGFRGVYCPGAFAATAAKVFDEESRLLRGIDQRKRSVVADGIRQDGDENGDKQTVCTPIEALSQRATHIVLGSTVLDYETADERRESFDRIRTSVGELVNV